MRRGAGELSAASRRLQQGSGAEGDRPDARSGLHPESRKAKQVPVERRSENWALVPRGLGVNEPVRARLSGLLCPPSACFLILRGRPGPSPARPLHGVLGGSVVLPVAALPALETAWSFEVRPGEEERFAWLKNGALRFVDPPSPLARRLEVANGTSLRIKALEAEDGLCRKAFPPHTHTHSLVPAGAKPPLFWLRVCVLGALAVQILSVAWVNMPDRRDQRQG